MRQLSNFGAALVLFALAPGYCSARGGDGARSLWEAHMRDAWVWASRLDNARLTKSHFTMPYHRGLSVAFRDGSSLLRYYFSMDKVDISNWRHYSFASKDILVEFHVAKEQWRLVWPNAQWQANATKAQGEAFRLGGLSRSHWGGTPWFDTDRSLVYDNDRIVALRYHMAFVMRNGPKAQELREARKSTHVVVYDLKTETWHLLQPEQSTKGRGPHNKSSRGDVQ